MTLTLHRSHFVLVTLLDLYINRYHITANKPDVLTRCPQHSSFDDLPWIYLCLQSFPVDAYLMSITDCNHSFPSGLIHHYPSDAFTLYIITDIPRLSLSVNQGTQTFLSLICINSSKAFSTFVFYLFPSLSLSLEMLISEIIFRFFDMPIGHVY